MGFLRGIAKGLVGFIFLLLLSALLTTATMHEATKEESIKPIFMSILTKASSSQNFDSIYSEAMDKCKTQASYNPPIENMSLSIECSKIKNITKEEFANLVLGELFDQKLYNSPCSGLDCLKMQDAPGFATRGFNLFLKNMLPYVGIAVLIFAIFMFLLSETWPGKFSSIGVPILINGLPAIPLFFFKQKIQVGDFQLFADKMIEIMSKYMMIYLVVGIILVIASITASILSKRANKKKEKKKGKKK